MSYLRGKQRELVGHKKGALRNKIGKNSPLKTDAQLAGEHWRASIR